MFYFPCLPTSRGGIFGFHPWLYVIVTRDSDLGDLMGWARVPGFEGTMSLRWPCSVSSPKLLQRLVFCSFYTLAPRVVGRALMQGIRLNIGEILLDR